MDRKVDFIVAGVQKAGTTALHHFLGQHSGLSLSNMKEVHYFDNEREFESTPNYNNYHKHFPRIKSNTLRGELTPIYLYWNDSMRRIYEYNKNMKIIILLRNPIERAYSHWNMERARNRECYPFYEALINEGQRSRESLPLQHRIFSYVDRGYYSEQIRRVRRYFKQENILILRHELLRDHMSITLTEIADFLQISPFPVTLENESIHTGSYKEEIPPIAREYLIQIFKNEVYTLEEMLHWDCKDWIKQ